MLDKNLQKKAVDPNTSSGELAEIAVISEELARLVASNPNANYLLLTKLAKIEDREVQRAITLNPNTPSRILLSLAPQFSEEFFANPVVDLLLLENPAFFVQLNHFDLLRLVKASNAPQWFLAKVLQYRNEQVWFAVAGNPSIADEVKSKLIATQNSKLCLFFSKQKNLSGLLIRQIYQVKIQDSYPSQNREMRKKIRFAIAENPNTELDILQQLAEDIEYIVRIAARRAIASHPQTNLSVIEQLAFDAEPSIKQAVASRHDLPIELIKDMAKDYQIARKGFLVRNRSLDRNVLNTLAQDSHPKVQKLVALHPNTSEKILIRLAKNPAIAIFLLQSPNLTGDIFEQLASSNNPKLYLALAQHSWTSRETLANIAAKSEDAATLIAVVENNQTRKKTKSEILCRLSGFSSRSVRQYVAQHPCTPENILWGWGRFQRYYKLHPFIAKNPGSPIMLLNYLAHKFSSWKVCQGLTTNPNTSEDILSYLCSKEQKQGVLNRRKIEAIAQKHKIPLYILDLLICNGHYLLRGGSSPLEVKDENDITFESIDKLIKVRKQYYKLDYYDLDRTYGIYLIKKSDLPLTTIEFLLEQVAQSPKTDQRKFAARHPKTPIAVLETLVKDEDRGVRDAAIFRLQQRRNSKLN
ncbi:MAG: hypothetical protein AAF378_20265 [Cyanobacteria bacterium P01_A01_bin.84]